jgi:hypothetical protein
MDSNPCPWDDAASVLLLCDYQCPNTPAYFALPSMKTEKKFYVLHKDVIPGKKINQNCFFFREISQSNFP